MTAARRRPSRRKTVMFSAEAIRATTNPYITELMAALPDDVEAVTFSRRRALFGQVDVLHVHWPETLFRRRNALRTAGASALLVVSLTAMRLRGVRTVRTVHNESPHEPATGAEGWLLRLMERWTDELVLLNRHTRFGRDLNTTVIPLGEHASTYAGLPMPAGKPGRALHFGLIRPYKGIDTLVRAFRGLTDPAAALHVVGPAKDDRVLDEVRDVADRDDRIVLRPGFLPDDALVREICEAHVVVLPYRRMHNSGAALLALSLGRPVLVPDNPVNRDLADETGPGWVRTYQGELGTEALAAALAEPVPSDPVRFRGRTWSEIGTAHAEVYRRVSA
ncbi:glycosyltransferase [Myceligenerans indicum]|uniref:Glycosyltransferase n=1 Tax=Myceligenerans indicum TaxID=2593663 RepID=A0ABS1LEL7_9MICO|nr:glycosyltransferase [Myceligenerans indicum]MBL0884722.1 glycosyltransferase [Myceligenerans indicum]